MNKHQKAPLELPPSEIIAALQEAWRQPGAGAGWGGNTERPTAGHLQDQLTPSGVENPLWDIVRWLPASQYAGDNGPPEPQTFPLSLGDPKVVYGLGVSRNQLATRYSWSIVSPGDVAWMREVLDGRPVVEIGAGSGYWAWQLQQAGVDVAAYDPHPVSPDNEYCKTGPYVPVLTAGPEAVLWQHPDRALLLCWPPYESTCAREALSLYCGDLLIYAGEGKGGCTADDGLYELLDAEWTEVGWSRSHVNWWGMHCTLAAYRRTSSLPASKES